MHTACKRLKINSNQAPLLLFVVCPDYPDPNHDFVRPADEKCQAEHIAMQACEASRLSLKSPEKRAFTVRSRAIAKSTIQAAGSTIAGSMRFQCLIKKARAGQYLQFDVLMRGKRYIRSADPQKFLTKYLELFLRGFVPRFSGQLFKPKFCN